MVDVEKLFFEKIIFPPMDKNNFHFEEMRS